jgi:thiol-disulfide isomerase/thioredoxin
MMFFLNKKRISALLFSALFLFGAGFASAQEDQLEMFFFYSETCPHCAAENAFLDKIEGEYPGLTINRHLITDNDYRDLYLELNEQYGTERYLGLVPITFMGDEFFLGFDDNVGGRIESSIQRQLGNAENESENGNKISLPIIGEINAGDYSLPALAAVLGFLDGFNVCSLGALILILALVLSLGSRSKIIIFGLTFILTTALVYGLLIGFWYKLFSFMAPYLRAMEITIGLLAAAGGAYFLKQFIKFKKYGPTCEMGAGNKLISKFSGRLEESFKQKRNIFLIFLTVLFFAGLITVVEFPCSAAVPVVFAGILANAGLSSLSYLSYIALFVFFYMLDEVIVFLVAVLNMKLWITQNKYVTWITLIEAIILFFFGAYYLIGF